jgi:hypothetical protein
MHRRCLRLILFGCASGSALAGMPSYDLSDIVALRLEEISFFSILILGCALGVRLMWNSLAKDFPRLPRLSYMRSLSLTALLGLLLLLVLTMISGARELLTPGAWRKQGATYRLNAAVTEPVRRAALESLWLALFDYAQKHGGQFPPHDFSPEVPERLWLAPDREGTRFIYLPGLTTEARTNLLACEPVELGEGRFALFANGEIRKLPTADILAALGVPEKRR